MVWLGCAGGQPDRLCLDFELERACSCGNRLTNSQHSPVETQYPVIKFVGKKILKWKLSYEQESMEWDLYWTDEAVQPEQLSKMQPFQKINHFPGMFSLARKNHLGRNLMKMKKQFPIQYKFFPQTWLLPAEYIDFKSQFDKTQKGKTKTFIVKPEALSQGKGIFLTRSLEDINPVEHYVVQRYLHKPLLIEGLKFDLRIYVLLAGCDPLRIFVYDEGLARFATEEYESPSKENMDNLCMHLTNYAINKENPNFIFNNDAKKMDVGHKRSLTSLMEVRSSPHRKTCCAPPSRHSSHFSARIPPRSARS